MPNPQAVDTLAQILAAEGYDPSAQDYLANRALQERIRTQAGLKAQRAGVFQPSKQQLLAETEALLPPMQMAPVTAEAGQDPGLFGGAFEAMGAGTLRMARGVQQEVADAMPGTFAINPEVGAQYRDALATATANAANAGALGSVGRVTGSVLPFVASMAAGPIGGAALLGGMIGSQSYGDARAEMGLSPVDAAVRAVLQGGLAAASAPIAPISSRLAPTGSFVRDMARGAGANAVEAIPQSMVMDYGGAVVDINQGQARGDAAQEALGRSTLEQLPEHFPEMLLAGGVIGGPMHAQGMRARDAQTAHAFEQARQAEFTKRRFAAATGMRDPRDPMQAGARLGLPGEQLAPGEAPRVIAADRAAKIQAELENAQAIQTEVAQAQAEQARQAEGEAMALRMGQRAEREDVRAQMGMGDLAAGLAEPAPVAGDNPVGGVLQQREAATAAAAKGVRARQQAEITRLEQEAERLSAESAAMEAEVEGRNAAENTDYLRAEVARQESAAAQAGALGRAEEYRAAIHERDRARKQLASAEPTAQEYRKRLDAAKSRLEVNRKRQEGIRSRMAPEPAPVAEAPVAAPVAPAAAPVAQPPPVAVAPPAPVVSQPPKATPVASGGATLGATQAPAAPPAPAGPPATSPPKHTVVTTADGATGASLSAALGVMRRTGNAMWNYLGGKKAIIAAKGYDGIIAAGKQVRRVVDAFGGSGLPTQMARRIVPGAGRAINDLNPEVVNLHTQVRDNPDAVVAEGHRLFDDFAREVLEPGYDTEAQQFAGLTFADNFSRRAPGSEAERAALMSLRFSKLTGGALGKGEPTVEDIPGGIKWAELAAARGTSREKIALLKRQFEANIRGHSQSLQGTEITQKDARQILTDAQQGDIVFVDPPYYAKDEGGDVLDYGAEYGADLTTVEGNLAFVRDSVFPAAQRGVQTIYSNYWNDAVAQVFTDAGFKVRKVARQGQHGKVVHEIIAWNPDGAAIRAEPTGAPAGAGAAPPGGAGPAAVGAGAAAPVVPSTGPSPAPAGAAPVRPGGADGGPRPSARLGGKLSDAAHQLAVADAAGVRGVTVGRDADGHTTISLDLGGGEKLTGRLVADERPDVEAPKDAWMASMLSRNRPEVVARALRDAIVEAYPTALVPSWLTDTRPPSIEKLVGSWKAIQQKFPQAVLKLMEKAPRLAVLLPNGKAYGADFAIGLTKHYQGRELREETWHLGWHTLTEAEKGLLLKRLPPAQRASVLGADGHVLRPQHALELGTDLLAKLYDRHLREGRKPSGWFGSLLARMRAKVEKLMPFFAPKIDAGMELAKEFGEGRIFQRMRKDAPKVGDEAMATASLRDTRRKVAAESDEGRTTVAAMNERAERILRDETLWGETMEAAKDDPRKLSQDQVRALNIAAADTLRASLTGGGEAKQAKLLDDYDMIAALRMRANRVSAQDLRALQEDDRNAMPTDRVVKPLLKPSGYWKRQLDKADTPDKAAEVMRRWRERNDRVLDALKRRGIDLRDEATRRAIDDAEADAVAALEYTVDAETRAQRSLQERWGDLTAARVVSDATMRTLLWPGSATLQGVSTANFAGRSGVRAGVESLLRGVDGLDKDVLAGFGGRREALGHMLASVATGMRLGLESVYTGDSVAKAKLAGREAGEEIMAGQEFRSPLQDWAEQPIKLPGLKAFKLPSWVGFLARTSAGPGLEAVRFVDEMVWTTTFDATRRMLGAKRAQESGRAVEEAMADQDIADAAVAHADRVTQRTRPDADTPFGAAFKGLELLRSPSLGGALTHQRIGHASKLLYNPLFHIMPIFRSVALLTAEAGKYAAAPVRGVQAAGTLRKLKSPERIAEMAAERGVGEGEIRRELTNDLLEQMTDTMIGMLGYGIVAALSEEDLPAPRGGNESAQEERTRDLAKPQGTLAGTNIQRMSPVYEALQAAAAARDVVEGRQSTNEALTGLGRAILEKPILGGVKSLFRPQTDPRTGEPMSMSEYAWSQIKRQTLSPGAAWAATARAFTETEQTRPGDPDNAGIGQERMPVSGLTGEGRTVNTGIIGRGIFGLSPRAKASEQRVADLIVRLNDAAEAEARKTLEPGQRLSGVGWWPDEVKKDLPVEGNRQAVERMTPEQRARMERLTGEAFWKALQPRLEEIERVGTKQPQAALKAMQRLRAGAAKQAFAAVWTERAKP